MYPTQTLDGIEQPVVGKFAFAVFDETQERKAVVDAHHDDPVLFCEHRAVVEFVVAATVAVGASVVPDHDRQPAVRCRVFRDSERKILATLLLR